MSYNKTTTKDQANRSYSLITKVKQEVKYNESLAADLIKRAKNVEDKYQNLLESLPEKYLNTNNTLQNLFTEADDLWKAVRDYELRFR